METAQGVVVFTQDNLDNAVINAKTMAKSAVILDVCSDIKDVFRSEVVESNMERDYATGLYNTIAEKIGGNTISSIGGVYSVEVTYDNSVVMVLNDIEASDEDEACDKARDGISVDDASLSFTLSYESECEQVETSYSHDYTIVDRLEYSATEE